MSVNFLIYALNKQLCKFSQGSVKMFMSDIANALAEKPTTVEPKFYFPGELEWSMLCDFLYSNYAQMMHNVDCRFTDTSVETSSQISPDNFLSRARLAAKIWVFMQKDWDSSCR
ncbi:hypothetical protein EGR_01088 [Echinococcus granulosus]|uniref:Uncharacterized protein n=1 Tax=Echinococcus granulosus TaxID=6210 RepID=W6UQK2_ECHGR|nr:hypothetical protein EGR_01088 [Echinococcus granulosus]EUB63960.1 hypothetical protein EGR_01088 [Echinococcus granulosus]